jgi:uracil-DNA glycosylase
MSHSPSAVAIELQRHRDALLACEACPRMIGPVVCGRAVVSPVLMVGQAPGDREGSLGRPFAWTAGKTLFKWYASIGLEEEAFRSRAYMAAVCRCFPGKKPKGGDRVPDVDEIARCGRWLDAEIALLRPRLLIPVGKLAISQFVDVNRLTEVVGKQLRIERNGHSMDAIALPHPSGASTWHRMEPGKALLAKALAMIAQHSAWRAICD